MLYLFILELTAASSHEFQCKTHRKKETYAHIIQVDVETLSGINEHLLAYPPKDECRNANPKKIQCLNYSGF